MSNLPAERLAELAPAVWERTARRMDVVRAFLAQPDRSTAAIQAHAASLGVSRPMFYKLLGQWRDWQAAGASVRKRDPRRPSKPDATDLATEAVGLCGPGATQSEVIACASRLAAWRNVDAPERGLVRRVHLRRPAGASLADRLGLAPGCVIDASPLAVRIATDRSHRLAVLTTLTDVSSGKPVRWIVTAGFAGEGDIVGLITQPDRRAAAWTTLRATSSIPPVENVAPARDRDGRLLRSGGVIIATVGGRMARIDLLARADPERPAPSLPLVDIEDLRAVARISLRRAIHG